MQEHRNCGDEAGNDLSKENSSIISSECDVDGSSFAHFEADWESEYLEIRYNPATIVLLCVIFAIQRALDFVKVRSGKPDGANGDDFWKALTWLPNVVCAIFYLFLAMLFSVPSGRIRTFCFRYYDLLCCIFLLFIFLNMVFPRAMIEVRRGWFQDDAQPHIQWKVSYLGPIPARECIDTDPARTWSPNVTTMESIGCNNAIFGFLPCTACFLFNILPPVLRLRQSTVICTSLGNFVIIFSALIATGSEWSSSITPLMNLLAASVLAYHFCGVRQSRSRMSFAACKRITSIRESSRSLLYRFIPEAVFSRISDVSGDEIGVPIEHCIVMFSSLHPQTALQDSFSEPLFHRLHALFSKFDDAVQRRGMFKYQHVGPWYIVACPRAANPFGAAPASGEAARLAADMALLAEELKQIAKGNPLWDGSPLCLKVGLASGPAAGVVIGSHRRFYCLYGDTVNTASRMCHHAAVNTLCDASFAADLERAGHPLLRCEQRGPTVVKGKGVMETYEVHAAAAVRGPTTDAAGRGPAGLRGPLVLLALSLRPAFDAARLRSSVDGLPAVAAICAAHS